MTTSPIPDEQLLWCLFDVANYNIRRSNAAQPHVHQDACQSVPHKKSPTPTPVSTRRVGGRGTGRPAKSRTEQPIAS